MKIELKDELYTVISDFYYKERLLLTQFKTLDEFLEFCTKQGFVKAMETVDLTKAGLYIRMARPEVLARMKVQGQIP